MTDTSLIDALKAERNILANEILNKERSGYSSQLELDPMRKRLANLNAHIVRLESPELVGRVQVAIMDATHDKAGTHDREAKAAIDAVLGGAE